MIRVATLGDVDFLLDLARRKYPGFDVEASREWLGKLLSETGNVDRGALVSDKAGCVMEGFSPFYAPHDRRINILFIASLGTWEGYKLLKTVIELAKTCGFCKVTFSEETGARFDVLAKRLGASRFSTGYVVQL